ncbi:adenosine deaminase [Bernardetia sp.]|uniref:adenosine deaminase n=1 Tax=Bernardetia sp. TaxID=1937974 RepID=UPI0025C5E164|nr:adenosine deaminase [Bernardetia sp.]
MKYLLTAILFLIILPTTFSQNPDKATTNRINSYLDSIRKDEARLRQFLSKMPKGADLHHHYSGSVYAETYLEYVEKNNLWINKNSFAISDKQVPRGERSEWSRVSSLKTDGYWSDIKVKIIGSWSKLYFDYVSCPNDEHFFSTFDKFSIPETATFNEGLQEIKQRAISENVSYIETMLTSTGFFEAFQKDEIFNNQLLKLQETKDKSIQTKFAELYKYYTKENNGIFKSKVEEHNNLIQRLHINNKIDDENFTMRYQNYFIRVLDPATTFKSFLISFHSASTSDLIVGVNIVAPENNTISMRDYWLHMQMFRFFKSVYPNVRTAMHAGELTLGLVKPEDLTFHINEAVFIADAERIGHGVDIAYEKDSDKLLKHMAENKIPIEISFSSNDFILGIRGNRHPILLYKSYGVPIVISTDDAGVLRTDLTEQFLILIRDYPSISYQDIKTMIFNSIEYSFLEKSEKEKLTKDLEKRFLEFEDEF